VIAKGALESFQRIRLSQQTQERLRISILCPDSIITVKIYYHDLLPDACMVQGIEVRNSGPITGT
jgi:hypothetical protein